MRVLLDTHILLRALNQPQRLNEATRDTLDDPTSDLFFSAASIWEIAVKVRLRRADLPRQSADVTRSALATGFMELPIA